MSLTISAGSPEVEDAVRERLYGPIGRRPAIRARERRTV
jgi:hypothetical protein